MNQIKSINNSMNQIINIYHKPRYSSSTEFYQYSTYLSLFNMYHVYHSFLALYISNHIQQTLLLQFHISQRQFNSIWIKPEKKFAKSSQITFDFQLKQIITKLSFWCMNSIQEPVMYTWHQHHIYPVGKGD